jgi:hypothetical protein
MYAEAGIDPMLFDQHRGRRGVIQHGAKLRTAHYISDRSGRSFTGANCRNGCGVEKGRNRAIH